LWGGIGSAGNPNLLPNTSAQTSAETPELMCTTVPPAKSSVGNRPPSDAFSNPHLPHTMCAIGAYTINDQRDKKSSIALNFILSANAPVISAGVMIANIS